MKNIVLIGMMGCGKSTAGRGLARRLGRELVDTDALIEAREGMPIPELFAHRGEGYFRDREAALCAELGGREDLILSCGGGLPLREDCMRPLKAGGTVIWLRRDGGAIYDSVDMTDRPLGQVSRQAFLERCRQREPVYRRWADHVVESRPTAEETLQAILEVVL